MLPKRRLKAKQIILLVLAILIVGAGLGLYHNRDRIKRMIAENKVWFYRQKAPTIKDIRFFGDDNRYLYLSLSDHGDGRLFWIGHRYMILGKMGTWEKGMGTFENKQWDEGEFFKLHIHDLEAPNPMKTFKTVDLYQMDLGKLYQGYLVSEISRLVFYQGQDLAILTLTKNGKPPVDVLFNLETHSLEPMPDGLQDYLKQRETVEKDLNRVTGTVRLYDILDSHLMLDQDSYVVEFGSDSPSRYRQNSFDGMSGSVDWSSKRLIESNFGALYPDMTREMIRDNGDIRLRSGYRHLAGNEQFFEDIIHWFAPKGQDKLDLYVGYPGSDERIPVSSYAEIKTWLAEQPKKEE